MQRGAGADTCRSGAVVPGELKRGTCRKKKEKGKKLDWEWRTGWICEMRCKGRSRSVEC